MLKISQQSVLLLFCLFLKCYGFSPELTKVIEQLHQECSAKVNVEKDLIKKLSEKEFINDPKLKCYIKCVMMFLNVITEDGEVQVDHVEATMPEELRQSGGVNTLYKCRDRRGADSCDTAFILLQCFYIYSPELSAMFE